MDSSNYLTLLPWNGLVLYYVYIYRASKGANPSLQMEKLQEACAKSTARMYICEVCGSDWIVDQIQLKRNQWTDQSKDISENQWTWLKGWAKQCWDFPSHHWATKDICRTSEMHESCSKNRMWLMQYPQEVMQCQKRLADILGPINREPSPYSLQLPANFRVDYSSMDHSKKEDGISLCVVCMWYQLHCKQRDSWTSNRIRTSFLW